MYIKNIIHRNGRPTEDIGSSIQKMAVEVTSNGHSEHASLLDLFRTPKLRIRTIAICFNWFVCGFCFFGVSQYIGHVSGNIFSNVAISAAILVNTNLYWNEVPYFYYFCIFKSLNITWAVSLHKALSIMCERRYILWQCWMLKASSE